MNNMRKIYLIAGEASGDFLGAQLMKALKVQSQKPVRFFGVGGEKMSEEGLDSLFPYHELSMLGFLEVLPHALKIFARVDRTVEDILAKQPEVVVSIDVPGFNLRVAKKLRKLGFKGKLIHYVAPTVWAYKPQRAKLCAQLFDHMLVLLPFEPPYFESVGLPCTFVGHPVMTEIPPPDAGTFRSKYELSDDTTLISVLPGSRKGEIERHMPIFAGAITLLAQRFPKLAIGMAVPRHVLPLVAPYFENCPFRAIVTADPADKQGLFAASNGAIVKSGTVTLEVAKAGIPMVVAYKVNPISAWMLRRIIKTPYVNLVNIIAGKEIFPELLQELCTPLSIADALYGLMTNEALAAAQKTESNAALATLIPDGTQSPSQLAANQVLGYCAA